MTKPKCKLCGGRHALSEAHLPVKAAGTQVSRVEELHYERRRADAKVDLARRARLADEELLPLLRDRLEAWREWGQALGPAEAGGHNMRLSNRQLDSEYQERHRARKLAWEVDEADFEDYLKHENPDKLTLAGVLRLAPRPLTVTPPLPVGVYDLIYADPPWRYEFVEAENRAIENQYPTMELDEICALPIADMCAEDSLLLLWATSPKLAEALQVMESWGFEYRSSFVWVKHVIGMGYWARQRHELLLVGRRGEFAPPPEELRLDSVIEAPRGEHSVKPEVVYEMIESMFPGATKVELFSRLEREGWHSWGNEVL